MSFVPTICNLCHKEILIGYRHRCESCDIDICHNCITTKGHPSSIHPHPLRLIAVSGKSLDLNENILDNSSFQDKAFVKTITSKSEKTTVSNKENKSGNIKTFIESNATSTSISSSSSSSSSTSSSQNSTKNFNFNINTPWVCPRCTFENDNEGTRTRRCCMCK